LGLRVVRFQNDEVMRNVSAVVGKIRKVCQSIINGKFGELNDGKP
jgi:very-short-patch-repair endonuclease